MYNPCNECDLHIAGYDPERCPMICQYGADKKKSDTQKGVPLSIDQLREMSRIASDPETDIQHIWVWIEILDHELEDGREPMPSAFYHVYADYTKGKFFCCGYPGRVYGFSYEEYGKTWRAFSAPN